jgi:predicted CoA-binding protein
MMTKSSKADVDQFISQPKLAVVGVSRDTKKFGNAAYKALKQKGYQVYPINRNVETIEGDRCYPALAALPEKVDGVVIVVPPRETEQVVREADAAGIKNVWMQQGAESDAAIQYCQEHGLDEVHGECIMMFAPPVGSVHRWHRGAWKLFGKLPK